MPRQLSREAAWGALRLQTDERAREAVRAHARGVRVSPQECCARLGRQWRRGGIGAVDGSAARGARATRSKSAQARMKSSSS